MWLFFIIPNQLGLYVEYIKKNMQYITDTTY